jgi:hypothetical protein
MEFSRASFFIVLQPGAGPPFPKKEGHTVSGLFHLMFQNLINGIMSMKDHGKCSLPERDSVPFLREYDAGPMRPGSGLPGGD